MLQHKEQYDFRSRYLGVSGSARDVCGYKIRKSIAIRQVFRVFYVAIIVIAVSIGIRRDLLVDGKPSVEFWILVSDTF